MLQPNEFLARQRWLACRNVDTGAGEAPPFAVGIVQQPYSDGTAWLSRPTVDSMPACFTSASLGCNGPAALPAFSAGTTTGVSYGQLTRDWPAVCLVDPGVAARSIIGTVANQWYMATGQQNFRCLGKLSSTLGIVVPEAISIPVDNYGGFRIPRRLRCVIALASGPDDAGVADRVVMLTAPPVFTVATLQPRWGTTIDVVIGATPYTVYFKLYYTAEVLTGPGWRFVVTEDAADTNDFLHGSVVTPAATFSHLHTGTIVSTDTSIYDFTVDTFPDP